jgi:hypothetical protein
MTMPRHRMESDGLRRSMDITPCGSITTGKLVEDAKYAGGEFPSCWDTFTIAMDVAQVEDTMRTVAQ